MLVCLHRQGAWSCVGSCWSMAPGKSPHTIVEAMLMTQELCQCNSRMYPKSIMLMQTREDGQKYFGTKGPPASTFSLMGPQGSMSLLVQIPPWASSTEWKDSSQSSVSSSWASAFCASLRAPSCGSLLLSMIINKHLQLLTASVSVYLLSVFQIIVK